VYTRILFEVFTLLNQRFLIIRVILLYIFLFHMKKYLSLVKFSHTIFAMPFAMIGFFLATIANDVSFDYLLLLLVIGCMVFGRNAAMGFNRYLDRDIDGANPRTVLREIPSGAISAKSAIAFVLLNSIGFIATTFFINPLCFYLSPIALFVILGYSYTKRFTILCHVVLGLGLALAPIGAYLAVANQFDLIPVLYGELGLNSIPVFFGRKNALRVSKLLHIACAVVLVVTAYLHTSLNYSLDGWHWAGVVSFLGLLIYQHSLVKHDDLSKVNLAFFTTNGIASFVFASFVILDFFF